MTETKDHEADVKVSRKSLYLLPPTYAPSLVFSHGKNYTKQSFCTISDESNHLRSVQDMRRMRCVACCYGWLILRSYYSTDCYLFNPVSLTKICLPPVIHSSYDEYGLLTSDPTDPNCFVVFYSKIRKSITFSKIDSTHWTEQHIMRETKRRYLVRGDCDPISCEGKIYLQFQRVMAVIDIHGTFARVKIYEKKLLDLSFPENKFQTVFLVESCGGVYKVFGIHLGFTDIIRTFDVFKLNFSTMDWEKVESLDNRIFLLGKISTSISATELGVKGNCIYFTMPGYTRLYRYDMDHGTIAVIQPFPKKFPHWGGPFWVVPNCQWQVKKDVIKVCKSKGVNHQKKGLKDIPPELLPLILAFTLADSVRLRLACKTWLRLSPSIESNVAVKPENKQLPWLMSFPMINKGVCSLHDPIFSDTYMMNIPELAGSVIRDAKFGWLLMSRGDFDIFFFHPLTGKTINLPKIKLIYPFVGISFSAPPTSSDCVVFGHIESNGKFVGMFVYHNSKNSKEFVEVCQNSKDNKHFVEDEDSLEDPWSFYFLPSKEDFEFTASYCNPIFYKGVFYCLSRDGKLGYFNPEETEDDLVWTVLPVRAVFPIKALSDIFNSRQCFLVECEGELMSIFVDLVGKPVSIFKLDRTEMKWVILESLDDKVVFLSPAASIVVRAREFKGLQNRIYFSRFNGENNIFYSLSTRSYHWFGSERSSEDWMGTWEHSQCSWIQLSS